MKLQWKWRSYISKLIILTSGLPVLLFPHFVEAVGFLTVTENSSAGTVVAELNATDANGGPLTYSLIPAPPSEFSPVLWLDANDSSMVIESGGAVSVWQDKSGNDYHFTQNDSERQPFYSSTSLAGLPAISFDGSNDYLGRSSRLGFSANPDISIIAVTSYMSLSSNDERIFQIGTNNHGLAASGGTGKWSWRFNGGYEAYDAVSLNSPAQQGWVRQAGTNYAASLFFYNGLEQGRTNGGGDTSSPTNLEEIASIGKSTTGSNLANVKISELIVLNDSSEVSRRAIETYLARKWGLSYTQPTSNGVFELESNGTLKTLFPLDRESVSSFPLTVGVTDGSGNFVEQNFSVSVSDDGLEDSDSDGFLDSLEIASGSDETNATSLPGHLPSFLGEATLWLDATNIDLKQNTTLSNGGFISAWMDQSGNGKNLSVIDSSKSPVLNSSSVNSKDVISFTGDSLKTSQSISVRSVLAVHKTLISGYLWDFRNTIADSWIYAGHAGSYWNHHISNGVTQNSVNGGLIMNNQLQVGYYEGSSNGNGTFRLHARYTDNEMGSGDICELLIFNRLLSQQEIDSGEVYLAKKWGLDSILDSDSDGFFDSVEYALGTNPESNASIPGLDYGLVAWYPFDGNTSDMSGNSHHGTAANSHSYVSAKVGSGVRIVGTSSGSGGGHIMLPVISSLASSDYTFSFWVLEEQMHYIHGEDYLYYGQIDRIKNHEDGNPFQFSSNTSYVSSIVRSSWNHYAVTQRDSINLGYLNGVEVAQGAWSSLPSETPNKAALGRHWWNGGAESVTRLTAIFDDLRIYDRALPVSQILELQTWTPPSQPPRNLMFQNPLSVSENQPVGTYVGQFSATDPNGDSLSFFLVSGSGSSDNSFFSLDVDGALRTSTSFDFENDAPSYSIRLQVRDEHNLSMEGNFTVSLLDLDDTAPLLTLNGDANITHEAGFAYLDGNASWSDAVDGSGIIIGTGDVNASAPGVYMLSYNYTDTAGNVAQTVTRTVHVVDTTAPLIALNGGASITHEAGFAYLDGNASWSDAVDGSGIIPGSGEVNASAPGVYSLSYNYTDGAGNVAQTITRTVHVVDTTAPLLTLNGDASITHEAGFAYLDGNASWSDAVDGSGTIIGTGEVNASAPGVYMLSYNYTDTAGNVAQTVTRTINVVDTTAPLLALNGDASITHEAGFAYLDGNASWSDAVDGSGIIIGSGEVNASAPGVYSLSYNYTDGAGNVAQTVTRTINVVDTTAPLLTLNGDASITHEAGFAYLDGNASWSDAVDGSGIIIGAGEVNASDPGVYMLSYSYTDGAGNVAQTVTRTINVVDTTAPLLTLNGDASITHEAGFAYLDGNASWSDAVDGSGIIIGAGEVNASDPGVYMLSYSYTDGAGNVAQTVTRTIHVVDTTAPLLTLNGDANITHEAGFAYLDGNASWSDAVDGSGTIPGSGEVNASAPGVYMHSYNYTDAAGNVAQTVTRTIHVVDTTAPLLTLNGDASITHEAGFAYLDGNASWSDAVDGSGIIIGSGEVNASAPGVYMLSYNYTDAVGNVAQTVTRTVHVVDTTAPLLTLNGDANITHEAGFAYLDGNASWSDAVDGSGIIIGSGEVNASAPGVYSLSYNYTDAAGNVAQTVTRTVHVVDTTAPLLTLNGDANITHEAGFAYLDGNASWSDAVDGSGIIPGFGEVNASDPGVYSLSYNYTDAAGNVAQTVTRTVHVVDTTAPLLTLNGDANITHEAGFAYLDGNASWSDAVDGSGIIPGFGEVNASDPGVYSLSYNYTDGAGNVAQTVTRTVHVVDTTAPLLTLNGDANITHEAGFAYLDGNASWSDAVDGSGIIPGFGEVNASAPGVYTLSYNYTDTAGNVAQTVTRQLEVINLAPVDLYVIGDANLSIHENELTGTKIGSFQAVDVNPDDILTFRLMNVMDANTSTQGNIYSSATHLADFFELDSNGTLFALRPLDFEVDPKKFNVSIQVSDQYGAFLVKTFPVTVLNEIEDFDQDGSEDHYDLDDDSDGYVDEIEIEYGFDPFDSWSYPNLPLIRTLESTERNQTISFSLEVLAFGGVEKVHAGVLLFDENGNIMDEFTGTESSAYLHSFEAPLDLFYLGQKIRYQAFAVNPAGKNFGQILECYIGGEYAAGNWWTQDSLLSGGWRESSWLGVYLPNRDNAWIYHVDLGWMYAIPDNNGGLWLWMPDEEWLWTRETVWPFLWMDSGGGWLYPIYAQEKRYFYDYTSESVR